MAKLAETSHRSPAGSSPARQGWPPAGSESCVVHGRPWLRSVDSEHAGRVMEPRKGRDREGRHRREGGRQHRGAKVGLAPGLRRGRRAGHVCEGFQETWEIPQPPRNGGSAKRRQRSGVATGCGKSEQPIRPLRSGNLPQGTRRRKGAAKLRNRRRER
jgi:hypothetical protein